jgi:hypothetical protein
MPISWTIPPWTGEKDINMEKRVYPSIDQYMKAFPDEIQEKLNEIREIIRAEAPEAEELIRTRVSYPAACCVFS